jgi:hypothetical protein
MMPPIEINATCRERNVRLKTGVAADVLIGRSVREWLFASSVPEPCAPLERGGAELRAERVIEIRHVAKSTVERNVDDARIAARQSRGSLAQPGPAQVPVRREPRDARERAHEMKPAEPGLARQHIQWQRRARIALDE